MSVMQEYNDDDNDDFNCTINGSCNTLHSVKQMNSGVSLMGSVCLVHINVMIRWTVMMAVMKMTVSP
ncbi:hypothetical protein E2C01_048866 [Portunus trituberculatus]|uniref:Uncharacterized protein n=1 Tax=Portunus trituberculatus TaxID=210409 RepID=A0A5B7GCB6_PORTR|nr:hypothetical protein [Portunus trituberculatus]